MKLTLFSGAIAFGASALVLAACQPKAHNPSPEETARIEAASTSALRDAYFGDLHVHTRRSFDAAVFNARVTPDDAYQFAKGGALTVREGQSVQLSAPLDFLAVTDHGEYLGVVNEMTAKDGKLANTEFAKASFGKGAKDPQANFLKLGISFVLGQPIKEIYDRDIIDDTWGEAIAAADRHYQPGTFTTFAGYEFTAMRPVDLGEGPLQVAANLHRNVIFRDKAPARLFSTLDSTNPENLWDWMDTQRAAGMDVVSIPHNSNNSGGGMFALETYDGAALSSDYSTQRLLNEPLMEITQIKGTSETHPALSPNDEWANFEMFEYWIGSAVKSKQGAGDFARDALGRGLVLEDAQKFNPYKQGFIGSSDTHMAAGPFEESNYWGKFQNDHVASASGAPVRADRRNRAVEAYSASGLAGVWAESNTREAIFDALRRKETFATSGPRIKVRSFAGFGFDDALMSDPDAVRRAYAEGVSMGGDLVADPKAPGAAPVVFAWGVKDPLGHGLERLQIVKVWVEGGVAKEAVIDAACAGGVLPDAKTRRCPAASSSVDMKTCTVEEGNAAAELKAVWRDESFKPEQRAAYYVRVLEVPSCRWSTWDHVRYQVPLNPDVQATIQERAWTSPIWFQPM